MIWVLLPNPFPAILTPAHAGFNIEPGCFEGGFQGLKVKTSDWMI
jgi:hypothetical protein